MSEELSRKPPSGERAEEGAGERMRNRPEPDAVARRAYERFEQRGRAHGYDVEDWLDAEDELTSRDGDSQR